MQLKIKYINDKRAMAYCINPKHKDNNPSLEITLTGEHTGDYYCHGCGISGTLTKSVLQQILSRKMYSKEDKRTNPINWKELSDKYSTDYPNMVRSKPFNVSQYVLELLGCGWDGEAFTFPFTNEDDEIIGIQRRFPDGFKCCIDGSRLGLFIPKLLFSDPTILIICEGVSDTATVLDMSYPAIGRPNNDSCNEMVLSWLTNHKIKFNIYIMADNDEAGITGANKLSELLELPKHHIIYPMSGKDIRASVESRGKENIQKWLGEQI